MRLKVEAFLFHRLVTKRVVYVPQVIRTLRDLQTHLVRELYKNVSTIPHVMLTLDGFTLQLSDPVEILLPDDTIRIDVVQSPDRCGEAEPLNSPYNQKQDLSGDYSGELPNVSSFTKEVNPSGQLITHTMAASKTQRHPTLQFPKEFTCAHSSTHLLCPPSIISLSQKPQLLSPTVQPVLEPAQLTHENLSHKENAPFQSNSITCSTYDVPHEAFSEKDTTQTPWKSGAGAVKKNYSPKGENSSTTTQVNPPASDSITSATDDSSDESTDTDESSSDSSSTSESSSESTPHTQQNKHYTQSNTPEHHVTSKDLPKENSAHRQHKERGDDSDESGAESVVTQLSSFGKFHLKDRVVYQVASLDGGCPSVSEKKGEIVGIQRLRGNNQESILVEIRSLDPSAHGIKQVYYLQDLFHMDLLTDQLHDEKTKRLSSNRDSPSHPLESLPLSCDSCIYQHPVLGNIDVPSRMDEPDVEKLINTKLSAVRNAIRRQIDFYFSSQNYPYDKYLRAQEDDHGWIPLHVVTGFNRIKKFTQNIEFIQECLSGLSNVEHSPMRSKVRVRGYSSQPLRLNNSEKSGGPNQPGSHQRVKKRRIRH